jgi:ABC-type sugar transport system ATPase subunit
MRKEPRERIAAKTGEAAGILGLDALLERKVAELSGGERQRVALARAIVRAPRVTLMDEPLSNLDALLRVQTREELIRLHREVPGTLIYVTHDQVEAMTLGDRIGVMNRGRLVQVGRPSEVYARPADRFVAGFIGSPAMAFLEAELERGGGGRIAVVGGLRLPVPDAVGEATLRAGRRSVTVGVRPEAVTLTGAGAGADWRVELLEDLGAERVVTVGHGEHRLRARLLSLRELPDLAVADRVGVRLDPDLVHFFDAAGRRIRTAADGGSAPVAAARA